MSENIEKKNPHQLTRRQHIIPASSISRFINESGKVKLWVKGAESFVLANPRTNQLFTVRRLWDQRTENIGGRIEQRYKDFTDCLIKDNMTPLDHKAISEMFILIVCRLHVSLTPVPELKVKDLKYEKSYPEFTIPSKFTLNDLNYMERKHITIIDEDDTISSQSANGTRLGYYFNKIYSNKFKDKCWHLIKANEDKFIFSDYYRRSILPVTPELCFVEGVEFNGMSVNEKVRSINKIGRSYYKNIYFTN